MSPRVYGTYQSVHKCLSRLINVLRKYLLSNIGWNQIFNFGFSLYNVKIIKYSILRLIGTRLFQASCPN